MKSETAEIDIVERLRNAIGDPFEHLLEAADKIEDLTERVIVLRKIVQDQLNDIERLREALQSIKKVPNSEAAYGIIQVFVDDALKEKE